MENPRNELPKNVKQFLNKLEDYLDNKLVFYGSIQRIDYIPGKSDIDIAIFTDNEFSTMTKMQHYLHVSKKDFEKIVWHIKDDNVIYGYKLKYSNPDENIIAEFSIYNEKFKDVILSEHFLKSKLPCTILFLLYILKVLFYKLNIIPAKNYTEIKRFLLSYAIGLPEDKFLVIKT